MVISGGVNIYPQEIENTLLTHAEVIDVAVFGVPDDDLGEKLAAVIQLSDGAHADEEKATELRELCRALGGGIKVPKLIRFCPAFPRLDNGKVLKRLLRDRVLSEPLPRATFGSLASAWHTDPEIPKNENAGNHYCPVNASAKPQRANTGAALRAILFGVDLKFDGSFVGGFSRLTTWGDCSECWKNAVCATHGVW